MNIHTEFRNAHYLVGADQAPHLARIECLVTRINRLRGLCKSAVGIIYDAGLIDDAEAIAQQIGDLEDV